MLGAVASSGYVGAGYAAAAAYRAQTADSAQTVARPAPVEVTTPRSALSFSSTAIAFDSEIKRYVLQFRSTKDGEVLSQIPARVAGQAYQQAQDLQQQETRRQVADQAAAESAAKSTAPVGQVKAPDAKPVVVSSPEVKVAVAAPTESPTPTPVPAASPSVPPVAQAVTAAVKQTGTIA